MPPPTRGGIRSLTLPYRRRSAAGPCSPTPHPLQPLRPGDTRGQRHRRRLLAAGTRTRATGPHWAGAPHHAVGRSPTANAPVAVISSSTAMCTPTGDAGPSGCRSYGGCNRENNPNRVGGLGAPRRPGGYRTPDSGCTVMVDTADPDVSGPVRLARERCSRPWQRVTRSVCTRRAPWFPSSLYR